MTACPFGARGDPRTQVPRPWSLSRASEVVCRRALRTPELSCHDEDAAEASLGPWFDGVVY